MVTMKNESSMMKPPSIKCGSCSPGSSSRGCPPGVQRRSHSDVISRRRCSGGYLPMLVQLMATLSCLVICHGFQAVSTRSRSVGGVSVTITMPSPNCIFMTSGSLHTRREQPLIVRQTAGSKDEEKIQIQGVVSSVGIGSNSRLFPQRTVPRRNVLSLTMTADDSSVDTQKQFSDDGPLLVRAWLSLRKQMAKLWALILKPFQLLKSLLAKIADDKKDTTSADKEMEEEEPVHEEVVMADDKKDATSADKEMEEEEPVQEEVAMADDKKDATSADKEMEEEEPVQEEVDMTEVENIAAAEETKDVVAEIESSDMEVTVVEEGTTFADPADSSKPATIDATSTTPRQATAHANVDLTGNWTLIVDNSFTSQYDEYLRKLGQPMLVRTVALTVIGSTKEETVQTDGGASLFIRGTNVRGSWERTLEASEQTIAEGELGNDGRPKHAVEGHELKPMTTADGEDVEVAAWWESNGRVHHSWVVGGKKYGGGDFENKRYLTDDGNILVCESTFHPEEEGREDAEVTWRFLREGAIYGDVALQLPNPLDFWKKEEKEGDKNEMPDPGVLVGDIMDNVASEIDNADLTQAHDIIDETIERESWVPPRGNRWAISAPGMDLTGKWKVIINEQFKKDYDEFLQSLGQPLIVRGAAALLIGNTREETEQSDNGRSIYIKGINAKGIWERTLTSSGSDFDNDGSYDCIQVPIVTADSERVMAESWWEDDGTKHVSWTYGSKRYGGGSFESKRYLENDSLYVCESTFHPSNKDREVSYLKWRFLREGAAFMPEDE